VLPAGLLETGKFFTLAAGTDFYIQTQADTGRTMRQTTLIT